ncbi:MAG: tetraacyldisaccharide 4'-kinase [Muribaculaceae bacterium]|nr:tetraacyldisaccharide 4'-kinase [Muribaculaceae bacterium]MDE6523269.1 tetraacyldisaccharide 4'-kinase [Muribaculaceae bacterium]
MATHDNFLQYVLTPFSWLYGLGVYVRNKFFDWGILKETSFSVPVVGVGNITVGGTGKTPHVEYILECLRYKRNIAVLSRGYKRKTRGFILASAKSTPDDIGDEPLQIYEKFGGTVKVAVCESRVKGIRELIKQFPKINLIVLDDSFQHRYIKPKVNIMLMDYTRPVYSDHILPLGRMRESSEARYRADMVITTKCPSDISALDMRLVSKRLELMPYQKLYFSSYDYGGLIPVFPDDCSDRVLLTELTADDSVILLTGVANPRPFVNHFRDYPFKKKVLHFPDHHDFKKSDLNKILNKFKETSGHRKIIITTEKDAMRVSHNPYFPIELRSKIFYIPIGVRMLDTNFGYDFVPDLLQAIEK